MNPESVAANLQISPYLPGRVSWAGRRMAYTLDVPVPYGETYFVTLAEARDRFTKTDRTSRFENFSSTFRSRDRAMLYLGTEGEEKDRLVLVNFSRGGEPLILTPADMTVLDFEPYPLGDRVLFSAVKPMEAAAGTLNPTLYTVATGLTPHPPEDEIATQNPISFAPDAAGTLTTVLTSDTHQNLAFDLSPNGKIIVVQRLNQANPGDFGPWVIVDDQPARPLDTEPGGEVLIGPDSQSLLMLQGQGTAIIPLNPADMGDEGATAIEPLDFLPEFGRIFDITTDGNAAAMVNFNQNDPEKRFTETLTLVTNQGEERELLNATGSIMDAQFDPTNRAIYILSSELLPGDAYIEQPFVEAINLTQQESLRLLTFPPQSRVSMNVSPDGLAMLLEVSVPGEEEATEISQLILLPLFATTEQRLTATPTQSIPQVLPYAGRSPVWLP
jgi:hypothetical protein